MNITKIWRDSELNKSEWQTPPPQSSASVPNGHLRMNFLVWQHIRVYCYFLLNKRNPKVGQMTRWLKPSCPSVRDGGQISRTHGNDRWGWQSGYNSSAHGAETGNPWSKLVSKISWMVKLWVQLRHSASINRVKKIQKTVNASPGALYAYSCTKVHK